MSKLLLASAFAVLMAIPFQEAMAVDYFKKKVIALRVIDTNECVMFKLEGVAEADPVSPGRAWLALPRSHTRFAEAMSILLTASAGGLPVDIKTTGQKATACGAGESVGVNTVGFP